MLADTLAGGCDQLVNREGLVAKLTQNRPLRVKLGVDPTAPDIHLGHGVVLEKLRQFQDAGHEAILIIGNFTALIGDPSGKSVTRPQLTAEEVAYNAQTYQDQAFKILSKERSQIVFNADWLGKMTFTDVIRLNSRVTLQQILQREDFRARLDEGRPIHTHEIQYPIMQGWDSVMVQADVELGGSDQLFNNLLGRELQKQMGQEPQIVLTMPILEGLDGKNKMSKSLGNYVALNEPASSIFGKLMSISDELMARYYYLLLHEKLPAETHPMEAKKRLAEILAARYNDAAQARAAREDFETRFAKRDLDHADLPSFATNAEAGRDIISLVVEAYRQCFSVTKSRSDVRRLVEGGSVQWCGEKVCDPKYDLPAGQSGVLKLDKTRAVRLH